MFVIGNGSGRGYMPGHEYGEGAGEASGNGLVHGTGHSEGAGKGKGGNAGTGYGFGSGSGSSSSGDSWEYDILGRLSNHDPDDRGVPYIEDGTAKFPIVTEYVWTDHYGKVELVPFTEYLRRFSFTRIEAEHELAVILLGEDQ